jgi:hypothetical protein
VKGESQRTLGDGQRLEERPEEEGRSGEREGRAKKKRVDRLANIDAL